MKNTGQPWPCVINRQPDLTTRKKQKFQVNLMQYCDILHQASPHKIFQGARRFYTT
jgi:hypothetical protein